MNLTFIGSFRLVILFSILTVTENKLFAQSADADQPFGFISKESAARQIELEKRFDSELSRNDMDQWMKRLTAFPTHVGAPHNKSNVIFIDSLFKSWGFDSEIKEYYVLFPTPKVRVLDLIAPKKYSAVLTEKIIATDPYTAQTEMQLPPYNAYSPDGDVTGQLIYVNYGLKEDYETLKAMGISVKGKIVIARYGKSWRGVKPKLAYEHGAIGCIIYSDPFGDGYYKGGVYPEGPFKNRYAVERGSVLDWPIQTGDPSTPGYASTKKAPRVSLEESGNMPKIPVIPISYHDAEPLLKALGGEVAPDSWQGALPIAYRIGSGQATVRLKVQFNWDIVPVYNVIAKLRGKYNPDEWVLRGNHHDAWVNGATDPVSGLVAMMGEAQSIGRLVSQGWTPNRTIVYCIWDGEEPALLGSTEWAEDYATTLEKNAVIYINTDNNTRGLLYAGGSPSLEKFFSQIAFSVKDPDRNISVGKRRSTSGFRLGALGTGSDYTPFYQHLGIATLNMGFRGEGAGGEYHTIYDNYTVFKRFKDPEFKYAKALSQVAGRTVLRMANADFLPFEFTPLYRNISTYSSQLKKLGGNFDFHPLDNALNSLKNSVAAYSTFLKKVLPDLSESEISALSSMVFRSERYLTDSVGLPGQEWYKNLLYAPGLYTGYGAKTIPGVRQAIERQAGVSIVNREIERVSNVIIRYSAFIDELISGKRGERN